MTYRLIILLSGLLLYGASITGSYMLGRSDGKQICTSKTLEVYKEGVQENARIEKQINRMVESDLDRSLSRWMR